MRVVSSDRTIKTAYLSYSYLNSWGTHPVYWRFLDSVRVSGKGVYHMYYNSGTFPNLSNKTSNYDKENGESDEADDYGYFVGNYHELGLLQKIVFPTGGEQTYKYGRYEFDKKRKYFIIGDSIVEMQTVNESGIKKGVRIQEVKTFDKSNHLVETKSYTYSNGVFYDNLKVYGLAGNMYPEYGWPVRLHTHFGLSAHIGYSEVEEMITNSQGTFKTIYQFDMGEDSYTSQNDNTMLGAYAHNNFKFGILSGQMSYGNKLHKWGKLMSVKYYNSDNYLLQSKRYSYNDIPLMPDSLFPTLTSQLGCSDTIVVYGRFLGAEISKKLYVYPDVLTQEVTYDYDTNGSPLLNNHTCLHDSKLRPIRETITDSKGIQHFTKYTYPDNLHFNVENLQITDWPALYLMQERNQIKIGRAHV